jgi:phosphinothricin acetyltransferase
MSRGFLLFVACWGSDGGPDQALPITRMSILIRAVQSTDLPTITAIYRHAVLHGTASFEIDPPDEAEMRRRCDVLLAGGFPYRVAEEDGRVLGYAYAGPYRPRPAYRGRVEDSIYVDPQAQRRGVGRLLLADLIATAQARGFRQMVAVIGDSSQFASIGLHHDLGFEPVGTLKSVGFKFGRFLDSVLMQRALGQGDGAPLN